MTLLAPGFLTSPRCFCSWDVFLTNSLLLLQYFVQFSKIFKNLIFFAIFRAILHHVPNSVSIFASLILSSNIQQLNLQLFKPTAKIKPEFFVVI